MAVAALFLMENRLPDTGVVPSTILIPPKALVRVMDGLAPAD